MHQVRWNPSICLCVQQRLPQLSSSHSSVQAELPPANRTHTHHKVVALLLDGCCSQLSLLCTHVRLRCCHLQQAKARWLYSVRGVGLSIPDTRQNAVRHEIPMFCNTGPWYVAKQCVWIMRGTKLALHCTGPAWSLVHDPEVCCRGMRGPDTPRSILAHLCTAERLQQLLVLLSHLLALL